MRSFKIIIVFVFQLLGVGNIVAQDLEKVIDLKGYWKFSIGDQYHWKEPSFDDTNWDKIQVPGAWENQGFYGYDGFAWYRHTFFLDESYRNFPLYLELGMVDDVDEVFFNGQKIGGKGSLPPKFSTAYNVQRKYRIPNELLKASGRNTIAVRVYDDWSAGGILQGDIGIFANTNAMALDVNLEGAWKFKLGDVNPSTIATLDTRSWREIVVPSAWEDQGYKNYDGYACYAKTFKLSNELNGKDVVLLLGKIDDFDQVYINGKLIAQHGQWREDVKEGTTYYNELRGYYLPKGVLNHNGTNSLVVRVNDIGGTGGIYYGEIGLISQKKYREHWHRKRDKSFSIEISF